MQQTCNRERTRDSERPVVKDAGSSQWIWFRNVWVPDTTVDTSHASSE
jgi:hypothetical protein